MKASTTIATFRRLRTQPLWRLLASDHGPLTLGLLQTHLYESERGLPASIFHERIERELEELRVRGEHLGTAQSYIAGWLSEGYLERRFRQARRKKNMNCPPQLVIEEVVHSSGSLHRNIEGLHLELIALLTKSESLRYEHG